MKISSTSKVNTEAEIDAARELFYSKFDTLWQEFEFLKRLVKNVPPMELDQLTVWWMYSCAAEVAVNNGTTKEEFIASMSEAFDEVSESDNENEIPIPLTNNSVLQTQSAQHSHMLKSNNVKIPDYEEK